MIQPSFRLVTLDMVHDSPTCGIFALRLFRFFLACFVSAAGVGSGFSGLNMARMC